MDREKVLAVINGKEVTGEDYNLFMESLNPQLRAYFSQDEINKEVVNELVYQGLLYQEAIEKGIDEDEDFQKVLNKTKETMLKTYALGKLLSTVSVTEDEVKEFFEEHKEELKQGESARASHILVEEEDKAKEIYEKIKNGEDFEALAREFSTCPSSEKGGDLGTFTKGQMVKEFEDAVFNNEEGHITEPVKTQFGYHIIKVVEKNDAKDAEFDEVKDKLEAQVRRLKEQNLYNNKINELKEKYTVDMKI